ncbi:MAG TPA: hypothetical protein VIS72_11360 [Anaerolineales bacterium]
MNNNQPKSENRNIVPKIIRIGLGSLMLALIGFLLIVYVGFPLFSKSFPNTGDWNLLEGFASAVSLALLIGGLIFVFIEYTNAENTKLKEKLAEDREKAKLSYEIYNAIYDKLTDPAQEAARRWILTNIDIIKNDENIENWYEKTHATIMSATIVNSTGLPEGQSAVKMTLNCFDYIGFIASHYWEVEADSLDWISAPIAKVWRRIGPYVLHIRTLRNTTDYYLSAEHVGNLCIEWRENKGLPDEEIARNTI